jgi:hypothetical protein
MCAAFVENVRTDICPVGPHDRSDVRLDADLAEVVFIPEWFEHAVKGNQFADVDVALLVALKGQPKSILPEMLNLYDVS